MRRFREKLELPDCQSLAGQVYAWGYQRQVTEHELEHGFWFTYGPDVALWYEWIAKGQLLVHLCVAPESRGHVYPRRFLTGMEILAEALGAEELRVYPLGQPEVDGPLASYVERLGWCNVESGWSLDLSGV